MSARATFNQVAIKALAVHSALGGGLEIGDSNGELQIAGLPEEVGSQ